MPSDLFDWIKNISLNRVLLVLGAVAVVLGVITWVVLFYSGGTYILSSPLPTSSATGTSNASSTALADANASSTASSTQGTASSTPDGLGQLQEYASTYGTPPISWTEGHDTLSITSATLSGSQLTLTISVSMGAVAECVPMNLRLVTDEQGDLAAPLNPTFTFGENGTCIGTPGSAYPDQEVVFTIDPASLPLSFTTGGTSNEYFELSTTATGGITIGRPATSG